MSDMNNKQSEGKEEEIRIKVINKNKKRPRPSC